MIMKEVISLPASGTQEIINKYLVHAHPHPRPYKAFQYMTLRKQGGLMERIYAVKNEFVLDPSAENIKEQVEFLSESTKEQILSYIEERRINFGFEKQGKYKFYLLKVVQELTHAPRTKEVLLSHTYFTYGELTSGRQIVKIASALNN